MKYRVSPLAPSIIKYLYLHYHSYSFYYYLNVSDKLAKPTDIV